MYMSRPAARGGPGGVHFRPCEGQAGQPPGVALLYHDGFSIRANVSCIVGPPLAAGLRRA